MTELHLPFPPSANRLWRKSKRNVYRSKQYENWLTVAACMARSQKPRAVHGSYKLLMHAVRPDKRRRDLDNLVKPVNDLLQSVGVVDDDCHMEMLVLRWVTQGEGIFVRVEPAGVE